MHLIPVAYFHAIPGRRFSSLPNFNTPIDNSFDMIRVENVGPQVNTPWHSLAIHRTDIFIHQLTIHLICLGWKT